MFTAVVLLSYALFSTLVLLFLSWSRERVLRDSRDRWRKLAVDTLEENGKLIEILKTETEAKARRSRLRIWN